MPDVIIVGGGPAGAATAWALARAGTEVIVLDRARFPRDKPCSEYLSPEASRVLHDMDALDEIERSGAASLAGMRVRTPGGHVIRGDFAASHGFRGFRDRGLALRRTVLDAIILDRARVAGARVEEGVRVTDVLRDRRGAARGVVTLDDVGRTAERSARIVVGADGLRSVVARRLGLARAARFPRRLALVTHYRGVADVGEHGEIHVERDGYCGIAAVGGGVANVAVVVPASHARDVAAGRERFLERWIARRPHLVARFRHADRVTPVHVTGPFAARARRAWAPRAALVGDAADFFDPFTGEGIYAALRGAELLAPAVVSSLAAPTERAADETLAAYDATRRAEFGGKWIVERVIGWAVACAPLMNHAGRVLSRERDLADLLVGVVGDFVPAREVLRPAYVARLLGIPLFPRPSRCAARNPQPLTRNP
ncbi:MAG: FAD-dependent oxidoreductase [Gemmatimonadota bacterium]|nr:FAD-dependent oxidoreductase [Gemmatimonadota bacterium]